MKTVIKVAVLAFAIVVLYHAVVGAACLYLTTPAVHDTSNCDATSEQFGRTWCMNLIKEPKAEPIPVSN